MKIGDIKRHVFRGLLSLHFVGLASTIGVRVASFGIYRATSAGDLQAMSFGRDSSASWLAASRCQDSCSRS